MVLNDIAREATIGRPTSADRNIVWVGVENTFFPAKKAHPAFEVNQIEEFSSFLQEKGLEIQVDHKLPGAKRFYLHDPFGNRLEFLEWGEK